MDVFENESHLCVFYLQHWYRERFTLELLHLNCRSGSALMAVDQNKQPQGCGARHVSQICNESICFSDGRRHERVASSSADEPADN
jgi:hypothetical protein